MAGPIGTLVLGESGLAGVGGYMTITAVASVVTASIAITVSDIVPPADAISIVRTNTLTGAQTPVRGATSFSVTGITSFSVTDYEAPLNVPVTYTVLTYAFESGVLTYLTSLTSAQATINAGPETCWLKNVNLPALNMSLRLVDVADPKYTAKRQATYIIGRSKPIVLSDVRSGRSSTLSFMTDTLAHRLAFLNLMNNAASTSLFLQVNYIDGFEDLYFNAGDITEKRNGATSTEPTRVWDVVYDEIDMIPDTTPAVGSNTYQNLLYWNSYQHMLNQRATYADVLNTTAGAKLGDTR